MRNPRDLCTREDVKALLPNYQEPTDPTEQANADALIDRLTASASQRIYEVSGREFLAANDPGRTGGNDWPAAPAADRDFDVAPPSQAPRNENLRGAPSIKVGDLASLAAASYYWPWSTGAPFAAQLTDLVARPRNRKPWQPIRRVEYRYGWAEGAVARITGVWGFPQVPADIREACAEQAAIWTSRDIARFGQVFQEAVAAGASPSEPRALVQSVYDTARLYHIPEV